MKPKHIVLISLLAAAVSATPAFAHQTCPLGPDDVDIQRGQSYSFQITVPVYPEHAGGQPSSQYLPLSLFWFGDKNGVTDLPASGQQYSSTIGLGQFNIGPYVNDASGAKVGEYRRYALVYDRNGRLYCSTNLVTVTLK